jgi:hypothetical protein
MPDGLQPADNGLPRAQREGHQVRNITELLTSKAILRLLFARAVAPARMRKVAPPQLDSVRGLLKQVSARSHAELYSVLRGHVYVGAVDNSRHLLQHQTQLYLVDTVAVWYVPYLHRCVPNDRLQYLSPCSQRVALIVRYWVVDACVLVTVRSCSIRKHCGGSLKWRGGSR